MLSELHSLNLKLCSKQYDKKFVLHLTVAPQLSSGRQHNYSTKTRLAARANEQSMYSLVFMDPCCHLSAESGKWFTLLVKLPFVIFYGLIWVQTFDLRIMRQVVYLWATVLGLYNWWICYNKQERCITFGWKGLPGTNTLAHWAQS